jgi:hypothetical protein
MDRNGGSIENPRRAGRCRDAIMVACRPANAKASFVPGMDSLDGVPESHAIEKPVDAP